MVRQIKLILLCVTICLLQVKCADKNTDENRPYEFGFTIEGEQHRHEKKDENGIIMGEFGFITADGVYHVTVYATDENGGFKILSMKNIRVKPYPTAKAGSQKGRSLEFQPSKVTAPEQEKLPQKSQKPGPALPAKSCSHCSIPTTTTSTETPYTFNNDLSQISSISQDPDVPPKYDQIQDNYPQQIVNYQGNSQQQQQEQLQQQQQQELQQQHQITSNQYQDNKYHEKEITSAQNYPQSGINQKENYLKSTQEENYGQSYENPDADRYPTYNSDSQGETYPQSGVNRQSKSYEQEPHQPEISQENLPTRKPQLISAQMQIVDKNTDIHYKHPGEKEGLPDGLTKDDMSHLLYTFNYTVGFHGHFEEGYTNGAKQGYYYVTGRNGIKTRVDYVADEHGFRPKITQEVLDLLSDDVPKTETEKDPKYGLKGYEFKWIYYPVDTKRR